MKRRFAPLLLISASLVTNCRSGGVASEPKAGEGPRTAIAVNPASSEQPPPHVFIPRRHPPRLHRDAPPPPNLGTLPRAINRIDACFGLRRGEHATPLPMATAPAPYAGSGGGALRKKTKGQSPPRTLESPGGPQRTALSPAERSPSDRAGSAGAGAPVAQPDPASRMAPPAEGKAEARTSRDDESDRDAPLELAEPNSSGGYHDWGASVYLSNDDTMSLSSAQRVIFAIDRFLPLPAEHIRPHEMLNYFSFDLAAVGATDDFSVFAAIDEAGSKPGLYSLALAVSGQTLDTRSRRNTNLSIVVDRSGSMSAEGRMEYLKRGLLKMTDELKRGDIINLVLFDHDVCVPLENYVVGRDSGQLLEEAIRHLQPRGSTDLHAGLTHGYRLADRSYQPAYSNRVIMITDALANTGVTDERMISMVGKHFDSRRIRLSGVGVGSDFNDRLLDSLTERGKGAYVFLGSEAEVDAVFGPRFVSLVETTANDVHFRLHLPPSLRMNVFYGEESSTVKEDVQSIHYFANTSQLFLSDLMAKDGALRNQDSVMLTIEYEHPENGTQMVEEYAFRIGDIREQTRNVKKGQLVMRFVDGLAWMASRPAPSGYSQRESSWTDEEAWAECEAGGENLTHMSRGLEQDPEVRRILSLWEKYCSRYARPSDTTRRPMRRPSQGWPGAQEESRHR